ncbi:uncharacterized protein LOC130266183 [Oenanthe melanoleuca]|uniref:uncharacterized protein LOC130266183 n=1 Tax=Oenanthe melanoleuca TaxID=2939378 RepID=UPI0024C20473|nr:uncharacterized protein LOC130266183 [Oenanthe melanoleuca]
MKVAVLSVALLFSILLCPLAQAKALLEGVQDDLQEIDLDNVAVLETPLVGTTSSASARPSPCMATTPQIIPVHPSTAQCTPTDPPDNSTALQILPRELLFLGPHSIPIPVPPAPPGCPRLQPPAPAVPLGQAPSASGQKQLLHPIAPLRPLSQGPPCFSLPPSAAQCPQSVSNAVFVPSPQLLKRWRLFCGRSAWLPLWVPR